MGGFGLAAAQAANRIERAAPTWFGFGAILGPIALLLLRAAPPGRCRSCSTPTRGWLTICLWCGATLTAASREARTDISKAAPIKRIPRAQSTSPISAPVPVPGHVDPPLPAVEAPPLGDTAGPALDIWRAPIGRAASHASDRAGRMESATGETRMLTTAIYVTGTTSLESGRRYVIAVHGPRLQVLGPVEVDPSMVVLDRPLAGMDATSHEGRLVVSGPGGRSGTVLVFMLVAGTTPDIVANAIVRAARTEAQA